MNKGIERTHVVAAVVLVAVLLINGFLGSQSGSLLLRGIAPFTAIALAVTALAWLRFFLARRSAEEAQEYAAEGARRSTAALFDESDLAPFTLRRTRDQVERIVVPGFGVLLFVVLALWSWSLAGRIRAGMTRPDVDWLLITTFLAGEAFVLFLFSRFLLGLGRNRELLWARGPGIQIGLASIACAAGAAAAVVAHLVNPVADRVAAIVFAVGLVVLAVEALLALIVAIYSPRRGEQMAVVYHSRIGGLLTDPAGWVRNFAHALDYQFGFEVSETWLYRMMQRLLIPLLLSLGAIVYLMSCFVFVGPEEQAVLEHFGKPAPEGWLLDSGLHVKAPWPVESIRRVPAKRVLTTTIGYEAPAGEARPEVILWTMPHHGQEDPLLVASRSAGEGSASSVSKGTTAVGLLSVSVPVEYRVADLKQFVYGFKDPEAAIQQVCRRVLVQAMTGRDMNDLLGPGRLVFTDSLLGLMRDAAGEAGLGIEILYVGLQGVHPPTGVAEAFQSVVAALEEKDAEIQRADAYAASVVPKAKAEAAAAVWEAHTYSTNRTEGAAAEAAQFQQRLRVYRASPSVYKSEAYLGMLRRTMGGMRKYVIDKHLDEILIFDFEEKLAPDLFDLSSESNAGGTGP